MLLFTQLGVTLIDYAIARKVNRSASETFDVIGTHMYENHPKWEPEVLEIKRITPDPVGVGSRAVMVRRDFGWKSEVEYVVTDFEPGRKVAIHEPDGGMDFRIGFEITPIDSGSCRVEVQVESHPQGFVRIFNPVMRFVMQKRGQRLADSMVEVIEAAPAVP